MKVMGIRVDNKLQDAKGNVYGSLGKLSLHCLAQVVYTVGDTTGDYPIIDFSKEQVIRQKETELSGGDLTKGKDKNK